MAEENAGTAIDMSRQTSGVLLNPEESEVILAKILKSSVVMQLASRMRLPGRGLTFQTITGEPEAFWVEETAIKPKGVHTLGIKTMQGYTLAVIEPISNQFSRDKKALTQEITRRLPYALAKKFDSTVITSTTAPGSNFDLFQNVTAAVDIETPGIWDGFVDAEEAVNLNDYMINGYALSLQTRSAILKAKDNQNRPIFPDALKSGNTGEILGQPAYFSNALHIAATATTPQQYGIAGDWSKAVVGIVEEVSVDRSDQSSITMADNTVLNLWERNMFALRAEMEVGFLIGDYDAFVRLVGADPTTSNKADKVKKADK